MITSYVSDKSPITNRSQLSVVQEIVTNLSFARSALVCWWNVL